METRAASATGMSGKFLALKQTALPSLPVPSQPVMHSSLKLTGSNWWKHRQILEGDHLRRPVGGFEVLVLDFLGQLF